MKSIKFNTLDDIKRIDDIALLKLVIYQWHDWKDEVCIRIRTKGLAHLPTLRVSNQAMAVNFLKWDLSCEFERQHNHTRYPEE